MKFFKWLYDKAIGDDIKTVKECYKLHKEGKPILDPYKKKAFINAIKQAPKTLFKESWYWILAIIFTIGMTWLVAVEYCNMRCNNFIYENFYNESPLMEISPSFPIFYSDVSEKTSNDNYDTINNVMDKGG